MRKGSEKLLLTTLAVFAFSGVALADVDDKPMVAHVSIGASLPQGDAGEFLDDGWAMHGGVTWFRSDKPLGWRFDFGLDWWDMNDEFLDRIDTDPTTPITIEPPDDGDARVWSGTANLLWKPKTSGTVGFYLTGGAGVYYTQAQLSETGYGVGWWCDWYWGICYPGAVEGEYVIQDHDSWEWGLNAGAGVTFKMNSGNEIYLESIYHWIDTENSAEYLPITIGIRW